MEGVRCHLAVLLHVRGVLGWPRWAGVVGGLVGGVVGEGGMEAACAD